MSLLLASAAPVAYTLTASAATFTLTGVAALPTRRAVVAANPVVFTETGIVTALTGARRLPASTGAFTEIGPAEQLVRALRLTADAATFGLTGISAAVRASYGGASSAGAIALTGVAAALRSARLLPAAPASLALAWPNAALSTTGGVTVYQLTADVGTFDVGGSDASLYSSVPVAPPAASGGGVPWRAARPRATIEPAHHTMAAEPARFALRGRGVALSDRRTVAPMVPVVLEIVPGIDRAAPPRPAPTLALPVALQHHRVGADAGVFATTVSAARVVSQRSLAGGGAALAAGVNAAQLTVARRAHVLGAARRATQPGAVTGRSARRLTGTTGVIALHGGEAVLVVGRRPPDPTPSLEFDQQDDVAIIAALYADYLQRAA